MPVSSSVSRRAAATASLSVSSIRPPGKAICPAWRRRCGWRSVSSRLRPFSRGTSGTSTAAGFGASLSGIIRAVGFRSSSLKPGTSGAAA